MLLKVVHTTTYRYSQPVTLRPHRMLLRPRASDLQRLISSTLVCKPAAHLAWTQVVFGNVIATASVTAASSGLTIVSSGPGLAPERTPPA